MMADALPAGWAVISLGDIIEKIEAGKNYRCVERPPTAGETGIVKVSSVTWGAFNEDESKTILNEEHLDPRFLIRKGDLLMSRANTLELVGASVIVGGIQRELQLSDKVLRLRLSGPFEEWINFFINSRSGRAQIQSLATGAQQSMRNISQENIRRIKVPFPPSQEQRRIVEKIETLFAQLDKGEESLREVQKLLARYRQSVLKAAVTGQLTAGWRAENAHRLEHGRDLLARILQTRRETWEGRGKYKEPAAPDTSDLPELPESWVWASIEQVARVIGGLTKNSKRQAMPLRKPMLRVANVYQNRLELSDVHETGVTETEYERVRLENRDLLVVEGNGSKDQIGRMAIWRNDIPDAVHQNHLIKIRMIEKGLVELSLWWFQSPNGRQNIERVASSTSGLYTLSISKIEALVVPIPSLQEVSEINERVDEAFSKIAQLESWCETELARSAALRQSILKDAFAGRLVPQDPSDEPAAELLARIRAGREAAPKGKTRRKATA